MPNMPKGQRLRIRTVLSKPGVDLWQRYKNRVEEIRAELIADGKTESRAAAAWDHALLEEPYKSAMLGRDPDDPDCYPDYTDGHADFTPAGDKPPEEHDDTVSQGIEGSKSEDRAWVAGNLHNENIKRENAPNNTAHNLFLWVKKNEANSDRFWEKFLSLAGSKEGQDADHMADDGRKTLKFVDHQIEQFVKDNPKLVGKKHTDFTDKMWEEAGQIVSGGKKNSTVAA